MSSLRDLWSSEVAGALEAHAVAVVQMAPGRWTFALEPSAQRVTAQLSGEWLIFDTPLHAAAAGQLAPGREVFTANASLAGALKLCVAQEDRSLRLRAELPLAEDTPVGLRVQQVCAGLAAAAGWLMSSADALPATALALDSAAAPDVDLEELCRAAAWPFTVRPPHAVMVTLDVPGTFLQASVELQPPRGVVVSVPVLPEAPQPGVCAAATAQYLLGATGLVRMVRVAAADAAAPICLEVVFADRPLADELAHAFAALSVAWSSAAREAAVLARDAHIAQLFLLERAHTMPEALTTSSLRDLEGCSDPAGSGP